MKLKLNPSVYIFVLYLILGSYLVYSYFSLSQSLAGIDIIDLAPIAYGVLILAVMLVTLSLFSLFRIPFFHYLFKMVHLWILILLSFLLWSYYEYGHLLSEMFSANTQQSIAKTFPLTDPGMFQPLIDLFQQVLTRFREQYVYILLVIVAMLAIIQVALYLPSSLRYVYHSHISPIKYTIKHILVSVILLVPLIYAANFYLKLDTDLNPQMEGFLAEKPAEVKVSENAFYPMLGVWLSEVDNKTTAGQQWLAEHRQLVSYYEKLNKPVKSNEYPQLRKLKLHGMDASDQSSINQHYVRRLSRSTPEIEKAVLGYAQRYRMPLQALRDLYKLGNYQNPINYTGDSHTGYFKDYMDSFLSLHRLNLLASLMETTSDDELLPTNMGADYIFNLQVIRNSSDPIVKLLYIRKQVITVEFINYLLQDPKYQNSRLYRFVSSMPMLDHEMVEHGNIARKKVQLIKKQIDQGNKKASNLRAASAYIIDYTFKYNETLNCIYEDAVKKFNLDNKSPLNHIKLQTSVKPKPRLDNIIGNIICNASIPDDDSRFYTSAIEANGKIMIVKARSKMLEDDVSDINISAFLTNNSSKFYNPFTSGALQWDRNAKQIYFEYKNNQIMVRAAL